MPPGFESRSLRQKLQPMMLLAASFAIFQIGAPSADHVPTLEAFLAARRDLKISGITASLVLDTLDKPVPIEIVGTAKGTIQIGDAKRYLFEGSGGTWTGKSPPPQVAPLLRNGMTARWIGIGSRGASGLEVQLVAGLENYVVNHYDERIAALAALPKPPPRNPLDTLGGSMFMDPNDPAHLYVDFVLRQNPALENSEAELIVFYTLAMSKRFGLDPRLTLAVMLVESGLDPRRRTQDGRFGLGGINATMYRTFAMTDAFDIRQAIWCVCKRLSNGFASAPVAVDKLESALSGYRNLTLSGAASAPLEPDPQTRTFIDSVTKWYKTLTGG